MYKEREVIDEELKKEVETLRNLYDTISLTETKEVTKTKILTPWLNGQASVCQATLQNDLEPEERYNTLRKLVAYQTVMLQFIDFPEAGTEEPEIVNMSKNPTTTTPEDTAQTE